jgi:hypothetical protein
MPPDSFLHERSDFKALVETVAVNAVMCGDFCLIYGSIGGQRLVA